MRTTLAAILFLTMIFAILTLIVAGLSLSVLSFWFDIKDQLMERQRRRSGR